MFKVLLYVSQDVDHLKEDSHFLSMFPGIGILVAIDLDERKANRRSDLVAVAPHILEGTVVSWIQIVLHAVDELLEVIEPNWEFCKDVF